MKSFLTKNFLLILIVILAAFLRFWHLGQNPPALFMDEASNGYNAYSILKTAKDEYGNFLPLTFRSFGEYNPALSVYALVPTIAILGLNEFSIRFPSALAGSLTVILIYLLTKKLKDDLNNSSLINLSENKLGLLPAFSAFFLAISPWHIQFSRYDHEANFMLFFFVAGITFFLYSFKKNIFLTFCAISFGLALNSYHAAKIWIPLSILMICFIYKKELLNFKSKLILPVIVLIIFSLPIVLNFQKNLIRGQSVGILNVDKPMPVFISNYLSHYSPNFLFIEGDTIGRHSVSGMGELYVFEIPLVLAGLLCLIKLEGKSKKLLIGWLLLAAVPASLATPAPHALRSIVAAPVWSIISALGVVTLASLRVKKAYSTFFCLLLIAVGTYNFFTYLHLYYKHTPKMRARDWQDGYKELVNYIKPIESQYSAIAITNYFGNSYIFVLFYTKYDPAKYHNESESKNIEGKYEFFNESWNKTKPGKALVVTPPWQAHPEKVLKEIYANNGELTFIISESK